MGTGSGARGGIEPFAAYAERLLIAAIAAGSRPALQRLHFQYFPQLAKFFGDLLVTSENEVIEDLIAETMFRVWREGAELPTQTSVHVWIMRTAYTCASKRLAIRGHVSRSSLGPPFCSPCGDNRPSTELRSSPQVLRLALGGLPIDQRAVVHLVYSGHSRQEVADILSMPCEAVDLHLAGSLVALDHGAAASPATEQRRFPSRSTQAGSTQRYRAAHTGCLFSTQVGREFRHHPSSEVLEFRDEVIVPKYIKAGVKKLAWIWPGESGDGVTESSGGAYENRYFATEAEAFHWCGD